MSSQPRDAAQQPGDGTVRPMGWNGQPTGKCDHVGCENAVILHAELSSPGSEYAAEADLCGDHIADVAEQARGFVTAIGALAPATDLDRRMRAVFKEHVDA